MHSLSFDVIIPNLHMVYMVEGANEDIQMHVEEGVCMIGCWLYRLLVMKVALKNLLMCVHVKRIFNTATLYR